MMQRWLAVVLSAALMGPTQAPAPASSDRELETGVQQAQEGDFEAAILTLDNVVRRLSAGSSRPRDLSRAYMYLAIAYLGLAQEQSAKAKFLEALKANRNLELSAKELPPQYLKFFEQVRKDALASGSLTPSPAPSPKASPTPAVVARGTPKKSGGGGGKKALLIGGGLLVVGGGVAVAGGGGGGSTPPATNPPTPTTQPATNPTTTTNTTPPGETPTTTTSTTQPTTSTTSPPGATTTTTTTTTITTTTTTTTPPTTTTTTTPTTTTTTTTQPPSCPNPNPPDLSGTVSGVRVVTCGVPGNACTVREVGLRLLPSTLLGFVDGPQRSTQVSWATGNHPNGNYTLQCFATFQQVGGTFTATSQVTVQN